MQLKCQRTQKNLRCSASEVSLSFYLQDFPVSSGKVRRSEGISTSEEGWVRDHFTGCITANEINTALDHGTGWTAPECMEGVCDVIVRPQSIILTRSSCMAAVPECWQRQMSWRSRELQPATLPFRPWKHDRARAAGSHFQVHKGEGDWE